jgi:hypothetical protein
MQTTSLKQAQGRKWGTSLWHILNTSIYAGINACTEVTKVENLEGLEELTHQLHG